MNIRRIGVLAFVVCVLTLAGVAGSLYLLPRGGLDPRDPSLTLRHVEDEVDRRWGVAQVATRDLEARVAETGAVLFDVRAEAEFAMGHLPGAVRVDPDIAIDAFYHAFGERLRGRPAIFYCSVGVRSSVLAARLASTPAPQAPSAVFNLRGGVFRWVAEGRELIAGRERGRLHPYDANWEQLLFRTLAEE